MWGHLFSRLNISSSCILISTPFSSQTDLSRESYRILLRWGTTTVLITPGQKNMALRLAQISKRRYSVIQKELPRLQRHDWWGTEPASKVFDKTWLLGVLKLQRQGLLECAQWPACTITDSGSAGTARVVWHASKSFFPFYIIFLLEKSSPPSLAGFGAMWLTHFWQVL